jgi:two-component sensor histidine kinase
MRLALSANAVQAGVRRMAKAIKAARRAPSAIKKVRDHILALKEIGHFAAASRTLSEFLSGVAIQVACATEISHVKILKYRAEQNDLLVVAGVGWKEGFVGHATFSTAMDSAPGYAFQTGMPASINASTKSHDFKVSPILQEYGIVSLSNVPILIDGAAWGVMEVDSEVPCDFFKDTEDFLVTIASIIASAIARDGLAVLHQRSLEAEGVKAQRYEMLLSEMQHRVKNNFQIILSMINNLRSRMSVDVYEKLSDNLMSMALAHGQLNPTQTGEMVQLPTYLRALVARLQKMADKITAEVHADEHSVTVERAVVLGLIVNELVTNAVKHAFDQKGGTIAVRLRASGTQLCLTVSDNGRGMKESVSSGSGRRFVEALARQIRGQISVGQEKRGTSIAVQFPQS